MERKQRSDNVMVVAGVNFGRNSVVKWCFSYWCEKYRLNVRVLVLFHWFWWPTKILLFTVNVFFLRTIFFKDVKGTDWLVTIKIFLKINKITLHYIYTIIIKNYGTLNGTRIRGTWWIISANYSWYEGMYILNENYFRYYGVLWNYTNTFPNKNFTV